MGVMSIFKSPPILALLLVCCSLVLLAACSAGTQTPLPTAAQPAPSASDTPTASLTPIPATAASTAEPTLTASPQPTQPPTLTPSPTPTATLPPVSIPALVWTADPQVPILTYHRFLPDTYPSSTVSKTRMKDLRAHLQALYDSGFSLVPLEEWLKGDLRVPAGRRPLVMTIDDAFSADQIFLDAQGQPSPKSAIGVMWQFAQEYPDFGFSASLFYNLGDKLYGNEERGNWFVVNDGWKDSLARAIVWGMDHQVMPLNHFYDHPRLDMTNGPELLWEASENERQLKLMLARGGRPELMDRAGNVFALTYGLWPASQSVKDAMLKYVSITGKPLLAVMEVDNFYGAKYLQPFYSPKFERWHVPRIVGSDGTTALLVKNKDKFPTANACPLGPVPASNVGAWDDFSLQGLILQSPCPDGVYVVEGRAFRRHDGQVERLIPSP